MTTFHEHYYMYFFIVQSVFKGCGDEHEGYRFRILLEERAAFHV